MADSQKREPQEDDTLNLAEVAARLAARQRPAGGDPALEPAPGADAAEEPAPAEEAEAEESAGVADGPARDESEAVREALEPGAAVAENSAGPELSVAERELSGAEAYAAVEALLFASDRPVSAAQIARALPRGLNAKEVRKLLKAIGEELASGERGYELRELGGGWQLLTREKFAPYVIRLRRAAAARKLSGSALETLAVVAYKQPVTRAEVERIRGVACGDMLRSLMDKRLVRLAGRSSELGSPLLYATTPDFLEHFGLGSLSDLPRSGELSRKPAAAESAAPAAAEAPAQAEQAQAAPVAGGAGAEDAADAEGGAEPEGGAEQ